ncbi:MAG: efflux RND transporter periplasmic adaptor subunit [Gemmatales bacterium]
MSTTVRSLSLVPSNASDERVRPMEHQSQATHSGDDIGAPPPTPRPRLIWLALLVLFIGAGVVGLFLLGWLPKARQEKALAAQSEKVKSSVPVVMVVHPRPSPPLSVVQLPGDVQALEETTIYPRTSGYMKKWLVDIGDEVKEGQLLAEIDAPEVDQEFRQAEATLLQLRAKLLTAQTNLKLAEVTLQRYEALPKEAVTKQELDEFRAKTDNANSAIKVSEADIAAGEANMKRIKELQSFSKITAPFPGTITARNIELGHLVTSGNGSSQSLFQIAKTGTVRVFLNIPQMYSSGIKQGQSAELVVREMPNRKFIGKITRTARAIDPITRTLRTEVQVPNEDHALLTGSYVQVRLNVARENPPVLIPASALIFNSDGTRVALLRDDKHVHLQPVHVEGDLGADVGIATGLTTKDQVVVNPGDSLAEGAQVEVKAKAGSGQVKPK